MVDTINAEIRGRMTRGEMRQMREQGTIPGVLYGKDIESSSIAVAEKDLRALLRENEHAVMQMKLADGTEQPVMVESLQRDPIKRNLLHVDFRQIDLKEPVRAEVRVEFVGEAQGASKDSLLQVSYNTVEVQALPNLLPPVIEADISHLEIGKSLTAGELQLPEGVELVMDPGEVIASLMEVQKTTTDDEAEAVEEAAQGEEEKAQTESE